MQIYRSRAPLRVSFAGGGTDMPPYCVEHGGQVISTTIDKFVHVTVIFNQQSAIYIHAYDLAQEGTIPLADYTYTGQFDLIKAVLKHFSIREGCDIHIHSDLPAGSGMGTSSALVVALISVFGLVGGQHLTKAQIAEIACHIERIELHEAGGYQDQYAASFGGVNFITFHETVTVTPIKIPHPFLDELLARLVLCYTGKTHISARIQEEVLENYTQTSFQEGMAALKECASQIRNVLQRGEMSTIDEFGRLLHHAWVAKKRLSAKITTDQVEMLYLHSRKHGVIGGKLLGAGGGGFLLLFCEAARRYDVVQKITQLGGQIVTFSVEDRGVTSWRAQ